MSGFQLSGDAPTAYTRFALKIVEPWTDDLILGMENALAQARKASGSRDVRIAGGANVIQQYLNAGLVNEFTIHYSPVFFGQGVPLFSGMSKRINAKIKEAVASKEVTHVTYEVGK